MASATSLDKALAYGLQSSQAYYGPTALLVRPQQERPHSASLWGPRPWRLLKLEYRASELNTFLRKKTKKS